MVPIPAPNSTTSFGRCRRTTAARHARARDVAMCPAPGREAKRIQFQEWLLRLRRRGVSVLIVHHAGKGGEQRGKSRREDRSTSTRTGAPDYRDREDGAVVTGKILNSRDSGSATMPSLANSEPRQARRPGPGKVIEAH